MSIKSSSIPVTRYDEGLPICFLSGPTVDESPKTLGKPILLCLYIFPTLHIKLYFVRLVLIVDPMSVHDANHSSQCFYFGRRI